VAIAICNIASAVMLFRMKDSTVTA
jgi:hypothetical protein